MALDTIGEIMDAEARHLRRLRRLFGDERSIYDVSSYSLVEDADRFEKVFPGCTVWWDHHPRIQSWAGHRCRVLRRPHDIHYGDWPEDGQAAVLVARRANEMGAYVQTRVENGRMLRLSDRFVERAVYVVSAGRWVVMR